LKRYAGVDVGHVLVALGEGGDDEVAVDAEDIADGDAALGPQLGDRRRHQARAFGPARATRLRARLALSRLAAATSASMLPSACAHAAAPAAAASTAPATRAWSAPARPRTGSSGHRSRRARARQAEQAGRNSSLSMA
jgi:pyruvate/2-oxoglutarate dehydrogenase complex dihydrolipoamide acyltransferase (E2) component